MTTDEETRTSETTEPVAEPSGGTGEQRPDAGAAPSGGTGADAVATEEAPSAEQLQKDYEELKRKLNEQGSELGTLRETNQTLHEELTRTRTAARHLAGGEPPPDADPVKAAWGNYVRAQREGTYEEQNTALQSWIEARDAEKERLRQAKEARERPIREDFPNAAKMLGVDDEKKLAASLYEVQQTLLPSELALLRLKREGKLQEWLTEDQRRREEAARQATLSQSVGGSPAGGSRIPGSPRQATGPVAHYDDWYGLRPEEKKKFLAKGGRLEGVPRGVDPEKEVGG